MKHAIKHIHFVGSTGAQRPAIVMAEIRNVGHAVEVRRSRSSPTASMEPKSSRKFKLIVTSETGYARAPSSIQ